MACKCRSGSVRSRILSWNNHTNSAIDGPATSVATKRPELHLSEDCGLDNVSRPWIRTPEDVQHPKETRQLSAKPEIGF